MATPHVVDYHTVVVALQNTEDMPMVNRDILLTSLPYAAEVPPWERHEYQHSLLSVVCKTLETLQGFADKTEELHAAMLEALGAELATAKALGDTASAAEDHHIAKVAEKKAVHDEASVAFQTACQNHAAAQAVLEQATERRAVLQQARDRAAAVLECPLRMLRARSFRDVESFDDAIEAVCEFLTEVHAEDALVAAVPGAFASASGPYSRLVEQGAFEVVTAHLADSEANLVASSVEFIELEAEALGLWAIQEVSRETLRGVEALLARAESLLADAKEHNAEAFVEVARCEAAFANTSAEKTLQHATKEELIAARQAIARLLSWEYPVLSSLEAADDVEPEAESSVGDTSNASALTISRIAEVPMDQCVRAEDSLLCVSEQSDKPEVESNACDTAIATTLTISGREDQCVPTEDPSFCVSEHSAKGVVFH